MEMSCQKYREAKASTIIPFLQAMQTRDIAEILKAFLQRRPFQIVSEQEIAAATKLSEKGLCRQFQTMYEQGEVGTPSTVMCWCDEGDFAKSIAQSVKLVMGIGGECEV